MDKGLIVAEGSPARPDPRALHARGRRAPVRRRASTTRAGREGRRPRRPGRGAARPAARLQPTTARRSSPRSTSAASSRSPCWSAAPRWRTSSSGSPAGRWWTDGDATPRPRRRSASRPASPARSTTGRRSTKRTWRGLDRLRRSCRPIFYVLAMGVLLGGFIEGDPDQLEGATSYLAFVVPGLVAAHAMQTAVGETTYPVMGMIKWQQIYDVDARHAAADPRTWSAPTSASCSSGWRPPARSSCSCWRRSASSRPGGGRSWRSSPRCWSGMAFATLVYGLSRADAVARTASACCSGSGSSRCSSSPARSSRSSNLGDVGAWARPADAAVARRQPVADVLRSTTSTGRLAAVNVAVLVALLGARLVLVGHRPDEAAGDVMASHRADRGAPSTRSRRQALRLLVLRNYIVYRTRLEALPHRLPRAGLLPASRSASASAS